jgi:hypothetical protein
VPTCPRCGGTDVRPIGDGLYECEEYYGTASAYDDNRCHHRFSATADPSQDWSGRRHTETPQRPTDPPGFDEALDVARIRQAETGRDLEAREQLADRNLASFDAAFREFVTRMADAGNPGLEEFSWQERKRAVIRHRKNPPPVTRHGFGWLLSIRSYDGSVIPNNYLVTPDGAWFNSYMGGWRPMSEAGTRNTARFSARQAIEALADVAARHLPE